jgi:transcription antitermination factor NusA-like protein
MKAPICGVCLSSGMLCRTCMEKVKSGKASETDVKVARVVLEMSGRVRSLKDVTLVKTAESAGLIVIICGKGDAPRFIGREGLTAKRLEKELGKKVAVVEDSGDMKQVAADMLAPARVI